MKAILEENNVIIPEKIVLNYLSECPFEQGWRSNNFDFYGMNNYFRIMMEDINNPQIYLITPQKNYKVIIL
jgi:hypothetical protein